MTKQAEAQNDIRLTKLETIIPLMQKDISTILSKLDQLISRNGNNHDAIRDNTNNIAAAFRRIDEHKELIVDHDKKIDSLIKWRTGWGAIFQIVPVILSITTGVIAVLAFIERHTP